MTEDDSMSLEKKSEIISSPRKIFGVRLIALIEILLFLGILTGLNVIFGDGNRFLETTPHPYWIIIILVATQYGLPEGLLAVFLSTFFLYFYNIPAQKPEETLFDYEVRLAWNPVMWFITAFILGKIRAKQESDKVELQERAERSEKEANTIAEEYINLKAAKESLEVHLAGQLKTTAATFRSFKSLGSVNPSQILMNLPSVVVPILNPRKFSVYFFGANGFEPVISHGWENDEKYKRRFEVDDRLSQAILTGYRVLTVINSDDEEILDKQGILAAPLMDHETHKIIGMLKIEEMTLEDFSISTLETFKSLCDLIGLSYTNAKQYKNLKENTFYSEGSSFYSYNFYKIQLKIFEKMAQALHFSLSQIEIKFDIKVREEAEPYFISSVLFLLLKEVLPSQTVVFYGKGKWLDFIILLPGASLIEAENIKEMLALVIAKNDELKRHPVSLHSKSL